MLRRIALFSGPLLFLVFWTWPVSEASGLAWAAKITAGIALWMAIWWILEPVETAVTALLPLVLFPLTGVMPLKATAAEYSNEIIYLFMAGFMFGKTIEKWNLHRRIALSMVARIGSDPARMLLGFMLATACVSMWISNTATAVMMTPVAVAVVVGQREFDESFAKSLLLGVGYASSIGGLATIVGTPTNGIMVSFVQQKLGESVSFWRWMQFGMPYALLLLLICWRLLLWLFPAQKRSDTAESRRHVRDELALLGPISRPEILLLSVFSLVVAGWLSGSLLWYPALKWTASSGDTILAVAGVILLFLLPSDGRNGPTLLDWKTAERIPWNVIVFFGGGLAMAKGFDESGLARWLGTQLEGLQAFPTWVIVLSVMALVVLLSEVASNIATASMMMPVLASLAAALGLAPFGLLLGAGMAASIGFGLPIACAANSIVFGAGFLTTRDMAKAGFLLDIVAILLLLAVVLLAM